MSKYYIIAIPSADSAPVVKSISTGVSLCRTGLTDRVFSSVSDTSRSEVIRHSSTLWTIRGKKLNHLGHYKPFDTKITPSVQRTNLLEALFQELRMHDQYLDRGMLYL